MKEIIELRIPESRASRILGPSEGDVIGGIARRISLPLSSPRFEELSAINHEMQQRDEVLITSWNIRRSYSDREMSQAELVRLIPGSTVEPAGEECGTIYNESESCEFCGVGRIQENELHLDAHKLRGHFVETIAKDEWAISQNWVEILRTHAGSSALFPIRSSHKETSDWMQLRANEVESIARVSPDTRFGISPFDFDDAGRFRCPLGHVAGLNILSQTVVQRDSLTGAGIYVSDKYVGVRQGLLRPYRLLIVDSAVWRELAAVGMSGWAYEVVVAN